jgi:membrane peptidoglycan carboxypeptidase
MGVIAVVMGVLVAGLALPFAGALGLGARRTADAVRDIPAALAADPLAQRTKVVAADGSLLAIWYDQNRVAVTLDRVAPIMRQAIVSIEDYRFYQHGALDVKGTIRAFITNQASSSVVQGGSSITQQMVKMTLINNADTETELRAATEDTYERKLNELRYAIAFEQNYSKDWILERYLNIAYFGDGAYGIEAAARHYFSKSAARLKLREAALLAGLVKNPSAYDPTNYPGNATDRRNTVLARMAELNVVSEEDAQRAMDSKLRLDVTSTRNGCVSSVAPFFCDYLKEYLLQDRSLGESREDRENLLNGGGLTIRTTLDPRFQRAADKGVTGHVNPTDQAIGGLAMVVPGTGEVRALAQSRPMGNKRKDGETYLNYVVPEKYGDANGFQAGSTFKVFVLAAAINQGTPLNHYISAPSTVSLPIDSFSDCKGPIQSDDVWSPSNSTGSGTFNLYTGTQHSVNTFFAQLEQQTGLCEPVKLARAMGVTVPKDQVVPAFTLGIVDTDPLTMAGAYATFAARGVYCEPRPVTAILNSSGAELKTYEGNCERVMPSATADAVNDILRGVQEPGGFGYINGLGLDQPSAGKTGTINENMSVWFIGYTPNIATAAMLAGANGQGHWLSLNGQVVGGEYISSAYGSTHAGPLWGDAMHAIEKWLDDLDFTAPDGDTVDGNWSAVPSTTGMDPSDAAALLSSAGFRPVIGGVVDSEAPQGTVAYTSPGSGSTAPEGATVVIYTSTGVAPPTKPEKPGKGGGNGEGKPPKPEPTAQPTDEPTDGGLLPRGFSRADA